MADEATVDEITTIDLSLKKKKKKAVVLNNNDGGEDAPMEDVPAAGEGEDASQLFANLKKKKKSSKKTASNDAVQEVETSMDNMFLDLKKKKKRSKKEDADVDQPDEDGDDDEDGPQRDIAEDTNADGLFAEEADLGGEVGSLAVQKPWLNSDRDYTYPELLSRVFDLLRKTNPDMGEKKKYTMIPPQVGRDGKKTIFANLHDMCRRMHRSMDHVIMYLFAELGTQGSVDGSQRLIIKGKFTQKQIETMMRGYISRFYVLKLLNGVVEYVTCKTCRSGETSLHKENRLTFLKCEVCGSNRTVAAIKSGFRAQTEKRRANK